MGSLPSGCALGPSPGFAASYLACAHAVIAGGLLLNLPMGASLLPIQTPEKSCGSNGKLAVGEGVASRRPRPRAGLAAGCCPAWPSSAWAHTTVERAGVGANSRI